MERLYYVQVWCGGNGERTRIDSRREGKAKDGARETVVTDPGAKGGGMRVPIGSKSPELHGRTVSRIATLTEK